LGNLANLDEKEGGKTRIFRGGEILFGRPSSDLIFFIVVYSYGAYWNRSLKCF